MKNKYYFVSIQTCYTVDGAGDIYNVHGMPQEEALKFAIRQIEEIPWDSPHFKEAILKVGKINRKKK